MSVHRLSKSIARKDFEIDEIEIAEARGVELLIVEKYMIDGKIAKPFSMQIELIASMALVDGRRGEIHERDVREMAAEDIEALGELVQASIPDGRKTGDEV